MAPMTPPTISRVPAWRRSARGAAACGCGRGGAHTATLGPRRGERGSHGPGDLDRPAGLRARRPARPARARRRARRTRAPGRRPGGARCAGRSPSGSGTASRGRSSASALAAPRGSMWPAPTLGPQPATGSSAAVERAGELGHLRVGLGVAREVHAAGHEPDAARRPADAASAARRGRPAPHARARRPARAPRRGRSVCTVRPVRRSARAAAARRHHRRVRVEPAQRRLVEVVVVGVREQDRVEAAELARHRRLAPQVRDPRAQQRVGDQARAAELEHGGRVPEPGDAVAHGRGDRRRRGRRRASPGAGDWPSPRRGRRSARPASEFGGDGMSATQHEAREGRSRNCPGGRAGAIGFAAAMAMLVGDVPGAGRRSSRSSTTSSSS